MATLEAEPSGKTRVWLKPVVIVVGATGIGLGIGALAGNADANIASTNLAAAERCRDFVKANETTGVAPHKLVMKLGETTFQQRQDCGLAYIDYLYTLASGTKYEVSGDEAAAQILEFPSVDSLDTQITTLRDDKDNAFGRWTGEWGVGGFIIGLTGGALALVMSDRETPFLDPEAYDYDDLGD